MVWLAPALGAQVATVTVGSTPAGNPVAQQFEGFSIERPNEVEQYFGHLDNPNRGFFTLARQLGSGVIRIGGNSADEDCWGDPSLLPNPGFCHYQFGPDDYSWTFNASAETGWPLLLSLNLGQNSPSMAYRQVKEGLLPASALGGHLLGLEIGNEPDLFYYHKVNSVPLRPLTYRFPDYFAEFKAYVAALKADPATASLPIVGPQFADSFNNTIFSFVDGVGPANLPLITLHWYAASRCAGPATAGGLLSPTRIASVESNFISRVAGAARRGLQIRMDETNSVSCGGQPGVSDAVPSMVWGADWMLDLARIGLAGLNFIGGGASNYSPILITTTGAGPTLQFSDVPMPLYYAMYLFTNAIGQQFLPVQLSSTYNIRAYALTACSTCPVNVFLVNKDMTSPADATVSVAFDSPLGPASYFLVQGSSWTSATVSYGGAHLDPATFVMTDVPKTVAITPGPNGSYTVPLPQATVALITIARSGSIAAVSPVPPVNAASYAPTLAPGSIATLFGQNLAISQQTALGKPWPLTLGGARLTFGNVPVPLYYSSPGQVSFQVPWEAAAGGGNTVAMQSGALTPATATLDLAPYAPGIFTLPTINATQGAVTEASSGAVAAAVGAIPGAQPVHAGGAISIYATGLGPVDHPPATGYAAPLNALVQTTAVPQVTVGGLNANVLFSGLAPGYVGLYQVNVEVPGGVQPGGLVPVTLSVGGVSSNTVTVAIQ